MPVRCRLHARHAQRSPEDCASPRVPAGQQGRQSQGCPTLTARKVFSGLHSFPLEMIGKSPEIAEGPPTCPLWPSLSPPEVAGLRLRGLVLVTKTLCNIVLPLNRNPIPNRGSVPRLGSLTVPRGALAGDDPCPWDLAQSRDSVCVCD